MSESVLVTGASGYLGGEIVRTLRARGAEVIAAGRGEDADIAADMTDEDGFRRALDGRAFDAIVHAAATVPKSAAGYGDEDAVVASVAMAETAARVAADRGAALHLISSMTVYPADAPLPVGEDAATGAPTSAYAAGKRRAEHVAATAGRGFAIRAPGLFGGARAGGLVGNLRAALQRGEAPRLPDAPLQWAAMDIRDAAEAVAALTVCEASEFAPVNIGYAGEISVSRLVELAREAFRTVAPYEVPHPPFAFDLSRFEALTGARAEAFDAAMLRYFREADDAA
ncbi:MAG: NAD(P)-dependent oxidoreductase [Pseudomonadota bacterium]